MSEPAQLLSSSPILAALDIDQTVEFYTDKLGFQSVYNDGEYLIFKRDDIFIHLSKYDEFTSATNPFTCYIYVRNVETLYAEYQAAGVVHPNGLLQETPYRIKEFAALDNNGNLLRIGELL
jgi:catechol 2,3-dioxygenase-like lactoylglutathione lyase family enzyme